MATTCGRQLFSVLRESDTCYVSYQNIRSTISRCTNRSYQTASQQTPDPPKMEPTQRFSDRVDSYVKYRPTYPPSMLQFMRDTFHLKPGTPVADIGSGTGIMTHLLLQDGYKVFAVEPNENMRKAAEQDLREFPDFVSVNGTGEATTLSSKSVDLITVAQAFHWLDPNAARAEFMRILKPNGYIALIWNLRTTESPFGKAMENIKKEFGKNYVAIRKSHEPDLQGFFADLGVVHKTFPHMMPMDLDAVKGQLLSSSYMPNENDDQYPALEKAVETAFKDCAKNGVVEVEYEAKIHYNPIFCPTHKEHS